MEERGIDRRVRKTKRQLRQALMDLMSEKPSKSISVRELAERADINRGTFYIHYKDVSDLLQRLEDEMAERLILVCKKYAYSTGEVDAFPYLTELYRFAQDNADLCLVLLGPNGDRAYTERICGILRSYFLRDFLARFYSGSSDRLDYFCSFIVSGTRFSITLDPFYCQIITLPIDKGGLAAAFRMFSNQSCCQLCQTFCTSSLSSSISRSFVMLRTSSSLVMTM